ncbi:MAG TPA: pseudouridine-5'-phosphate glycosidase [Streptosporangiaceae bacterium]|nr:pseudouridine-5'-phosphate glycosidase [Streptosporangiaceae bacterium]
MPDVPGGCGPLPVFASSGSADLRICGTAATVGGTLAVCRLAGIRFMATGGTGGVHRGFAATPHVSADLPQVARTQALVVSTAPAAGRLRWTSSRSSPRRSPGYATRGYVGSPAHPPSWNWCTS